MGEINNTAWLALVRARIFDTPHIVTLHTATLDTSTVYRHKMSKLQSYLSADRFPSWFPLHHFNEPKYNYATGLDLVDFKKPSLWAFVGMVAFNPIFWNAVARNGEWPRWLAWEVYEVLIRNRVPTQDYHQDCQVALCRLLHSRPDHLLPVWFQRHSVSP